MSVNVEAVIAGEGYVQLRFCVFRRDGWWVAKKTTMESTVIANEIRQKVRSVAVMVLESFGGGEREYSHRRQWMYCDIVGCSVLFLEGLC